MPEPEPFNVDNKRIIYRKDGKEYDVEDVIEYDVIEKAGKYDILVNRMNNSIPDYVFINQDLEKNNKRLKEIVKRITNLVNCTDVFCPNKPNPCDVCLFRNQLKELLATKEKQ